jgi:alpha-mannosidase
MHDERRRIEERVQRLHDQRIKAAVYAATVPFEVEAWQAPGEPVCR